MSASARSRVHLHEECGVGIIEIVVAMFLLALLVLSFAPVLVSTISLSGKNTTIATATQIVNKQIEAARALSALAVTPPSCSVINSFISSAPAPIVDPRGVVLQATWDPIVCPTAPPWYVKVRVSVNPPGATAPMASASTIILVAAP